MYRKSLVFKEDTAMSNNTQNNVFAHVRDEKCEESSRTGYEFSSKPNRHDYSDISEYYCDLIRYYEERDMLEEADEVASEYDDFVYGRFYE
jgi:hypothetical protein